MHFAYKIEIAAKLWHCGPLSHKKEMEKIKDKWKKD